MLKKQQGFTLVEVIVVASIIAILGGILIPLILKEIDEARVSRAYGDIRALSAAMLIMKKDAGAWPNLDGSCNPNITLLVSDGVVPSNAAGMNFDSTSTASYNSYFPQDDYSCYGTRWKGPYIAWVTADPWGNAYLTNANAFSGSGSVWILSAGPNGLIDTDAASVTIVGDDVGIRIK